jgi:ADP-ribosylglycohydrolase/fructose-1,6-bisphosphatase/inositol monophosphatase family enzyme
MGKGKVAAPLADNLSVADEAARAAGAILCAEFHRPGGPRGSGEHAPADEEAEQLIRQRLLAAYPKWGYRGEETGFVAGGEPFLWLVDPNDGTSAFLKGYRGSAVSIGLLRDGIPVLGVVYAFAYPDDDGDLIAWAEGCPLTRNGQVVEKRLNQEALTPKAIIFLSQDADRNAAANAACVSPARYIALPSIAYRLARVAAGDGVGAVSLSSPCAWDYAAGQALLRGAGGVLVNEQGQEVTYTLDGHSSTQWCFGGSPAVARELSQRSWRKVFGSTVSRTPPFCLVRPVRGRAVMDQQMLSRAQGCLLGQLAGDSLGGLVEFQSRSSIAREYPNGCRDMEDGGTWGILAGQPTDDSELALMLARCFVHNGRFDPVAALDAYIHWYESGPFDVGSTIGRALSAAASVAAAAERLQAAASAANAASESNGALMRISPLGIFGAADPAQAAGWAREDCRLTHPNSVCQDACAVFVAALATGIGQGGGAEAAYSAAAAEAAKPGVQRAVRQAVEAARETRPGDYTHQMGWALIALQNAFYQLLHAPTLEEGVVDTVMHGGDTDTNAAIAGALLGAIHGRQGVPGRWIAAVQSCRPLPPPNRGRNEHPRPEEFWPVDALELAEALVAGGTSKTSLP